MTKIVPKYGFLYEDIRSKIKPLDLILFRGSDFVSDVISLLEYKNVDNTWGNDFTHVGMILTREVFDDERLEEGKLYILESTMSGKLGQNVYDINGNWHLGVQIRDFDKLMPAYDDSQVSQIGWCPLVDNPVDDAETLPELREKLTAVIKEVEGDLYNLNFVYLLSAVFKRVRIVRKIMKKILHVNEWWFCSELVAHIYKRLGLIGEDVVESYVLPVDFIPLVDADNAIPSDLMRYPVLIVSSKYYCNKTTDLTWMNDN